MTLRVRFPLLLLLFHCFHTYTLQPAPHRHRRTRLCATTATDHDGGDNPTAVRSKRGKYPRIELHRHAPPATHTATNPDLTWYEPFGIDRDTYSRAAAQFPALDKLDVATNLLPKMRCLNATILRDQRLLTEVITTYPQYFAHELEKTIAVRHAFLRSEAHPAATTTATATTAAALVADGCAGLQRLLAKSDDDFLFSFFPSDGARRAAWASFKPRFLQGGLAAARHADAALIALLLAHGWDPASDTDRNGMTVLMWACAQGRRPGALATVKTLVERGGCDVRQRAGDGTSCLMWAATGGSLAVCEYLAARGADPSLPDADGSVPLHWAAGSGAADIVDWLLTAHRADLRTRNAFGCTVAHFAASGGQLAMCRHLHGTHRVDFLEENGHGHDALAKAVAFRKHDVARWLLDEVYGLGPIGGGTGEDQGRREEMRARLARPWPWDDGALTLPDIAARVGDGDDAGRALLLRYLHPEQP